jgi:hypothetical protein
MLAVNTAMTDGASNDGELRARCYRCANSLRARALEGCCRDARLRARRGCVWSVTVKDPRRFPNKRHCARRARPPKRASPSRTGAARSQFSTSKYRGGFPGSRKRKRLDEPAQPRVPDASVIGARRYRRAAANAAAGGTEP